ncbi:hypothetical protein [Phenylobacterium sp.]|jgi:hypothetical protein
MVLAPSLSYVEVNKAYSRRVERRGEELLGFNLFDLTSPRTASPAG